MYAPPFNLALVTGATSGIGLSICRLLAAKKIPLIITGRDTARLGELVGDLSSFVSVTAIAADLGNEEGRKKIAETIRENTPDLVINNAGFGQYGEAIENPTAQLQMVEVNIKAVLELTMEATKVLKEQKKGGVILNVSSVAGFMVIPLSSTYAASKAFVTTFSESLDFELSCYGIRVLVSCPGVVATNFRERAGGIVPSSEKQMSSEFAAQEIWNQIERKQRVRVFDWKMRVALFFIKYLIPTSWIARRMYQGIKTRKSL